MRRLPRRERVEGEPDPVAPSNGIEQPEQQGGDPESLGRWRPLFELLHDFAAGSGPEKQSGAPRFEAAAFRRLVEHLRSRTDVQNIDLMNLAGFCRNCLSNWMKDAADHSGVPMTKDESRAAIYGMPFEEWKAKYQNDASKAQLAAFAKSSQKH